jgi:hypothetical protein
MKKPILCLLLLSLMFAFFNAHAQNFGGSQNSFYLGIKGGVSIPSLGSGGGNQLSSGYKSGMGADAALFAEFKFGDMFSIMPMIEYSSQGGKKDGIQAFPTPPQVAVFYPQPYLYANFSSTVKLGYIMLPILAKISFDINSSFSVYGDGGPFVGYLLNARQSSTGSSPVYSDASGQTVIAVAGTQSFANDMDIKGQLNKINFGVEGNIGLAYKLDQNYIFIEGGGNYGLKNIQNDPANGKNNTGAATVTLGYIYSF